jgi:hypothetical protein
VPPKQSQSHLLCGGLARLNAVDQQESKPPHQAVGIMQTDRGGQRCHSYLWKGHRALLALEGELVVHPPGQCVRRRIKRRSLPHNPVV